MEDLTKIDNIVMLTDIQSKPHLYLDITLKYVDPALEETIRVDVNEKYRIVYYDNRQLNRIVGVVKNITRIFKEDKVPDYLITIDGSTEFGSNIKTIKTSSIRAIRKYVLHLDDDTTIEDAKVNSGIIVAPIINNVVIDNATIDDDGNIISGDITDGELDKDNKDSTITEGIVTGTTINNNIVIIINSICHGGTIIKGNVIHATTNNNTTIIKNGDKYRIEGPIENVIINHATVINCISIGGTITEPVRNNTIVYGGTVTGDTITSGDTIYNGDTVTGGVTTGGTVIGGYAVTTINNKVVYIIGDIKTTGGTSYGGVLISNNVIGGTVVNNIIIGGKVINGNGPVNITIGGNTTGGEITYDRPKDERDYHDNGVVVVPDEPTVDPNQGNEPSITNPEDHDGLIVALGDVSGVVSNFHSDNENCDKTEEFSDKINE